MTRIAKSFAAALLLLCCMALGGCSILPGEDRSFPVCLGLHTSGDTWQASVRISTYKSPGEYTTVTASGKSLAEAMTLLDASSPIRLHYGHVRLIVFSYELASSDRLAFAVESLARLGTFRADAALCATEDDIPALFDALTPASGTRLSKHITVLLESRIGLGVIPETTLGDWRRMGERQSPLLIAAALGKEGGSTGMADFADEMNAGDAQVQFGGAYLVAQTGKVTGRLTMSEHQVLRLMQGRLDKGALAAGEHALTLLESSAKAELDANENAARLTVGMRYMHADQSEDGVRETVTEAVLQVIGKLAAANCDALGLGRQAIMQAADWAQWRQLAWPEKYPALTWHVAVDAVSAR